MKHNHFISEFKAFITRGNVMDLAVGVIIGTAFTAIVNSLVNDIIMPVIGILIGDRGLEDFTYVITPATYSTAEAAISSGAFIQSVVNFFRIAVVIFLMVKSINSFRRKKEAAPVTPPATPADVQLLTEIRDLLQAK